VINDFTALALALPALRPTNMRQLGAARPHDAPIALIGPGTGLVSPADPERRARAMGTAAGEGGHVTLAAPTARGRGCCTRCARICHASAERAISGQGLEALYAAFVPARRRGRRAAALPAAEITNRGLAGSDPQCVEAIDSSARSRNVAGNLALTSARSRVLHRRRHRAAPGRHLHALALSRVLEPRALSPVPRSDSVLRDQHHVSPRCSALPRA